MDSPDEASDVPRNLGDGSHPRFSSNSTARLAASQRGKKRTRTNVACVTCRYRRTKCDSKRPSCTYCRTRGVECHYEEAAHPPVSRTELELVAINERLDRLTTILTSTGPAPVAAPEASDNNIQNGHAEQEDSPFRLLGTASMMRVLGLGANFAEELMQLERSKRPAGLGNLSRFFMVQQQQAISALAAFSEHVHIWYPILRPGFSEQYFRIISGPLTPSSESCLALMVAAIGSLAQNDASGGHQRDRVDTAYFEAALTSLPMVLEDSSVTGVQCLVLFCIYYCCLLKPCQAHDYCLIASFKVQNLLKRPENGDSETREHIRRAYWAVLLLESELSVQFDVAKSGIWSLEEHMSLPDSRRTWEYSIDVGSPLATNTSPASALSKSSNSTDKVQSYFLAEISMRRMLHRCNTAIRRTHNGKWVYAPGIALELELQLDEWYNYLPAMIRFDPNLSDIGREGPSTCSLTNFLRVQYYCCKMSIYWPAVYQAVQDGKASEQLLEHCLKFFTSFMELMPDILASFENCIVNRWTLFASIFMTSMATMKALQTPCCNSICPPSVYQNLSSAIQVNLDVVHRSPSSSKMYDILSQRINNDYTTPAQLNAEQDMTAVQDMVSTPSTERPFR